MGLGLPLVFVSFPIFPFIFFGTEEEKTIELISPWLCFASSPSTTLWCVFTRLLTVNRLLFPPTEPFWHMPEYNDIYAGQLYIHTAAE
jgi:hypothetical protein